jgi:ubiquinone/menaquinone biosynthesis C-methylase UbiE
VGVGTGNEVLHILQVNSNVKIVAVDYSETAFRKAYRKALASGKKIEVLNMDARCLEFAAGSFDKVLCLHVTDFVEDNRQVTSEILRVLKDGGRFVITYPSDKEGLKLGCNLLRDVIRTNLNSGKHPVKAFFELIAQMLMGFVYLPLVFRPKKKFYLRRELEAMITGLTTGHFQIEEDSIYQDFIVYGRKSIKGGGSGAS